MEKLNDLIVEILLETKKLKDELQKEKNSSSYWYQEYLKLKEELKKFKPETKEL